MLKTTISKIKRVCTLVFIPRFGLRNWVYNPHRFQRQTLTQIQKTSKSTKSGSNSGKEKDENCEKCKKIIELAFGPSDNAKLQITNKDQTTEDMKTPDFQLQMQEMSKGLPNKREGKEANMAVEDQVLQVTTLNENDEKLMQKIETIEETPLVEAAKPKLEGFNVTPKVLGDTVDVSYSKDRKATSLSYSKDRKVTSLSYSKESNKKYHVHDESGHNYHNYEHYSFKQTQTPEKSQDKKYQKEFNNLHRESFDIKGVTTRSDMDPNCRGPSGCDHYSNQNEYYFNHKQRYFANSQGNEINLEHNLSKHKKVKTKIPLKQISYLAQDSTKSQKTGSAETNLQLSIDELAKRCLDSPSNQIDERLLKEMEKFTVPQTKTKPSDITMSDKDAVQIDILKKPRKPVEKTETDLETRKVHRNQIDYNKDCVEKLYPPYVASHIEKEIMKRDLDVPYLKYEKVMHNLINNLIDIKKSSAGEEHELPMSTNTHTTYIYAMRDINPIQSRKYTDLLNKQVDDWTYINSENIAEKTKQTLPINIISNKNGIKAEKFISLQNKQTDKSMFNKSENINENSDQILPIDPNIYIEATEGDCITDLHSKEAENSTYNKPQMTNEKLTNPTVNDNQILLDNTITHYDKIMRIISEQSQRAIDPNQVLIDPYDKKTLSRDTEEYDFDNKTLSETSISGYKHRHTEKDDTPRFLKTENDKEYARIFLAPKETFPVSAHELTLPDPPVTAVETVRLAPCSNADEDSFRSLQNIDDKTANVGQLPEFPIASATELERKKDIIEKASVVVSEAINVPKSPETSVEAQVVTNTSAISFDSTQIPMDARAVENINYTEEDIKINSETSHSDFTESNFPIEHTKYRKSEDNYMSMNENPDKSANIKTQQSETIEIEREKEECPIPREGTSDSTLKPEAIVQPPSEKVDAVKRLDANLSSLGPLPKLNEEDVSLSELLRRIRERNKMEECKEFASYTLKSQVLEIDSVEGRKCGKKSKSPPCPPPKKNPCPPPPCPPPPCPPPPCPAPAPKCPPPPPPCPKPKPCNPQPCPPPKKKNPCDKFIKKGYGTLGDIIQILLLGQQFQTAPKETLPVLDQKEHLSSDVLAKLRLLGFLLRIMHFEGQRNGGVVLARDFDPWTPIPSWPIPKKEEKRPLVCPKDGCKMSPPVTPNLNLPYKPKHCPGFPKLLVSITNLLSPNVSNERLVFDLGDF